MVTVLIAWAMLLFGVGLSGAPEYGRLALCGLALLFAFRRHPRIALPGGLALAWLAWAAWSSWSSPWPALAWFGYYGRYEGLATWIVLFGLALAYRAAAPRWGRGLPLDPMALVIVVALLVFEIAGKRPWGEVGAGALAALCAVWLHTAATGVGLLALPVLLATGSRAGLVAAVAGIAAWEAGRWGWRRCLPVVGAIAVAVAVVAPWTPAGRKLAGQNWSALGSGARSTMAVIASESAYGAFFRGFGLDTQSRQLAGPMAERPGGEKAVCDRAHSLPLDLMLQTGAVGLVLASFALGAAIWYARRWPSHENRAAVGVVVAWAVFGMFNPQGIPAHALMLTCLFVVQKDEVAR